MADDETPHDQDFTAFLKCLRTTPADTRNPNLSMKEKNSDDGIVQNKPTIQSDTSAMNKLIYNNGNGDHNTAFDPLNSDIKEDQNNSERQLRPQRRKSLLLGSGMATLSSDTYSFLVFSRYTGISASVALTVFVLQTLLFCFVVVDTVDLDNAANPLGMLANVGPVVRASQLILIILAVAMQDDIRSANLSVLHGYDSTGIASTFNDADGAATRYKWIFSIFCRYSQGVLGLAVTIARLFVESTVIELLFNFTALEFVSQLDSVIFYLLHEGYFGVENQRNAMKITNREFHVTNEGWNGVFPKAIFAFLVGIGVSCWSYVFYMQETGEYMCKTIYVQFDDGYSTDMAAFSGLYDLTMGGISDRKRYIQNTGELFYGKVVLGYCVKEKAWTLTHDFDLDPCKWVAKSSEVESDFSYDILDTSNRPWFTTSDGQVGGTVVPVSSFQLTCYDCEGARETISCGDGSSCYDNQCDCVEGRYGYRCEFELPCTSLEVDSRFDGFLGNRVWAKQFDLLKTDEDDTVNVYGRPVFINDDAVPVEVMLFNGRRWVLTTEENLAITGGIMNAASVFHGYLSHPVYSFMSEAMVTDTPKDGVTPLQLDWYLVPNESQLRLKVNDFILQPEAKLLCAKCNDSTNPCAFEGVCTIDNSCECTSGSHGALCQIPPLRDGQCNPLFNTPEYGYDGGDCCQNTCSTTADYKCGTHVHEPAFGIFTSSIYYGYDECKEPSQLCKPPTDNCLKPMSNSIPFKMTFDESSRGYFMHFFSGGMATAISGNGNLIATGNPGGDSVKVYQQDGSYWEQLGGIIDGQIGSRFGFAVALSFDGSTLAIGAPYVDNVKGDLGDSSFEWGDHPGYVNIYKYNPILDKWHRRGQTLSSGVDSGDLFGNSLSLSKDGNKVAIGCPRLDVGELSSIGIVKVYYFNSAEDKWVQEGNDIIGVTPLSKSYLFFGHSVSLSSTLLAVGCPEFGDITHLGEKPRSEGGGHVRIFKLSKNKEWIQQGEDIEPGRDQVNRSYGFSVAITEVESRRAIIAVGDPMEEVRGTLPNAGSVRVFHCEISSCEWQQVGNAIKGSQSWLELGANVALSEDGTALAVGARSRFSSNAYSSLYDFVPDIGWQERKIQSSELSHAPGYLVSLSNDSTTLVVGAIGDGEADESGGSIHIFNNPSGVSTKDQLVSITIMIQVGYHPEETSLNLACGNQVHLIMTRGSLSSPKESLQESFFVSEGSQCSFQVSNIKKSEMSYEIFFGYETGSQSNLLAKGGGSHVQDETISFVASHPDIILVPITLRVRLHRRPHDIAVNLICGSTYLFELRRGAFEEKFQKEFMTFHLQQGSECHLTISDAGGPYGLCCRDSFGSYQVYYGDQESVSITNTSNLLIYGNVFQFSETKEFLASPATSATLVSPQAFGIQETRPKEATSSSVIIAFHILLDDKPEETGFSIKCDNNFKIHFPPTTFAGMERQLLSDALPMAEGTVCSFTIVDSGGNGLFRSPVRLFEGDIHKRDHDVAEILLFDSQASFNFTAFANGGTTVSDFGSFGSLCHDSSLFSAEEIAGFDCDAPGVDNVSSEVCFQMGGLISSYTCNDAQEDWIFSDKLTQENLRKQWNKACCINKDPSTKSLITLAIELDAQPHETQWKLDCGDHQQFESNEGFYEGLAYMRVIQTFSVKTGSTCDLTMFDTSGNGMCCAAWFGSYQVFYGQDIENPSNLLAFHNGTFQNENLSRFAVSVNATIPSMHAVTVHIRLNYRPFETGFGIQCDDGTFVNFGPGSFPAGLEMAEITESFLLEEGTNCRFVIEDTQGDGLCCDVGQGFARLYAGYPSGYRSKVFAEILRFELQAAVNFQVPPTLTNYSPESICSSSRDMLVGDAIAGMYCADNSGTSIGDSNSNMTKQECLADSNNSWQSYNCNDVERDVWVFQDQATKAFLRSWWESKCCPEHHTFS